MTAMPNQQRGNGDRGAPAARDVPPVGGPSARGQRARDARARQTRARVLDSAVACIDELGITRASSNEIARRADTTWGTIQHHFGSRSELLLAVIESNFAALKSRVSDVAVVGGTTLDRLQALADLLWDYCSDVRFRVTVEILLDLRRDPEASEPVTQRVSLANKEMTAVWDGLCDQVLGRPVDPAVQRILFASARGFALHRHMNTGEGAFTQERALLVRLLAASLDYRDPATRASDGAAR
jgi:AcrR family transcriptional regulator